MKNKEEFAEDMVSIQKIDNSDLYGYYPFHLLAETKAGKLEFNALLLGGDVKSCYKRAVDYIKKDAKRIYMALDFPAGGDIENDFVVVYSIENGKLESLAIPYDIHDGKRYEYVTNSKQLDIITEDFNSMLKQNIEGWE